MANFSLMTKSQNLVELSIMKEQTFLLQTPFSTITSQILTPELFTTLETISLLQTQHLPIKTLDP